jgi:Ca2+-binding RTX toxin-like protein
LHPTHAYTAVGTYTVTLHVRDDDGGVGTFSFKVNVTAVGLQLDPCDPTGVALFVGGTDCDDKIRFTPVGSGATSAVHVMINGVSYGIFRPTTRIIAYGLCGDDDIGAAGALQIPMLLDGGAGDDRRNAGNGGAILLGGGGCDELIGGSGRDILVGGTGSDRLVGNGGEDILIAGTTDYDANDDALWCDIYRHWLRNDLSAVRRVADLSSGNYPGGFALNTASTHDDGAVDSLTGSGDGDWFFYSTTCARDRVNDRHPTEFATRIGEMLRC